jgi:predicted RNA binding protein YcfA (HicA-like mRNA interferase family)
MSLSTWKKIKEVLEGSVNPFTIGRKRKDIVKHITNNGWNIERQKGDHDIFSHPKSPNKIAVPRHSGDIPPGTVRDIMKKMVVNEENIEENSTGARFAGTNSLTNIYSLDTPGQCLNTLKRILRKEETDNYEDRHIFKQQ